MSPLALILFVGVAGVVLWLFTLIPMDATIARILHWVVVAVVLIVVVLWFFALFGVGLSDLNQPLRVR
jgi:hypothetical protein